MDRWAINSRMQDTLKEEARRNDELHDTEKPNLRTLRTLHRGTHNNLKIIGTQVKSIEGLYSLDDRYTSRDENNRVTISPLLPFSLSTSAAGTTASSTVRMPAFAPP